MTMNLQLLVRVKSKVKLNLLLDDGSSMVEHPNKKETHFVLFENVTDRYSMSIKIIKELW
jgi:uncharacterized protein with von Willebrand factor type A (vWA) domain